MAVLSLNFLSGTFCFCFLTHFVFLKSEPFGMLILSFPSERGFNVTLGPLPFGEATFKSLGTLDQTLLGNWDG